MVVIYTPMIWVLKEYVERDHDGYVETIRNGRMIQIQYGHDERDLKGHV